MRAHHPLNATLLAIALATAVGLAARADAGHDHAHPAAATGHDHSQHSHSQVQKIGTRWEAGIDLTDWKKPARACPAHPQIVSNRIGSNCPITSALTIDRPTAAPRGAAARLGMVLLPASGQRQPLTDARIRLYGAGKAPLALHQKDGYYWVDLPSVPKGPLTLDVSQGGQSQRQRLDHLAL
jgi:hypothetical protein